MSEVHDYPLDDDRPLDGMGLRRELDITELREALTHFIGMSFIVGDFMRLVEDAKREAQERAVVDRYISFVSFWIDDVKLNELYDRAKKLTTKEPESTS